MQRGWRTGRETQREREGERKKAAEEEGKGEREREEERFKEPPGYKTLCFVTSENIGTCITTPLTFCLFILVFFRLFHASEDIKASERRNILEGFL